MLKGKKLSEIMAEIAEGLFEHNKTEETDRLSVEEIKDTLVKLNRIASNEITAEGNNSSNMLSTASIREIVKDYKNAVPQIVILGAKGSGKTYIYKQMIAKKTLGKFNEIVDKNARKDAAETLIIPLISSANRRYIHKPLQECLQNVNDTLRDVKIDLDAVNANYYELIKASENNLQKTEWMEVWRNLIINMLGKQFADFAQIDEYLENKKKRILFLVDGLEDLFMDSQSRKQEGWKFAIRMLCQDIVNELRNQQFGNIGIIVFARKDMVEEAIEINFEQFRSQYSRYELKWTPTEALRLVVWIASQANPVFGKDIDILKSSRDVLEERLELLWGKKLGKPESREAVSSRWVIAALSDFTGQLQARDIVRFLKFASDNQSEVKMTYTDRYMMPPEIRKAISECSKAKLEDIKDEMKVIYEILEKFKDMDEGEKQLPLTLDKMSLTGEEIAKLESQGYLIISDKKYYMPEIIRFALGFSYLQGARPKVLSLLAKSRNYS